MHILLSNFHHHKEWYRITSIDLLGIVKFMTTQQEQLKIHFNQIIETQTAEKASLSIDEFVNLSKPKVEYAEGYYELDEKFFCSKCNKDYKTFGRMQNHLKENLCKDNKTGDYKCPKCSKAFSIKHYFDKHCAEDTCGLPTVLKCTGCSKEYSNKKYYDKHIEKGCKPYTCARCNLGCYSQIDLNKHMNRKNPCAAPTNIGSDEPPKQIIFKEGARTLLNDIRAKYNKDITSTKILQIDERFTQTKQNVCRSCYKNFTIGCCPSYKRGNLTSRLYINNLELIDL